MSLQELQGIMNTYPTLTAFGFGVFQRSGMRDIDAEMKKCRQQMLEPSSVASYEKAKEWLRSKIKLVNLNRRTTSYFLKHVAEKDMKCYISNGMFIAAAVAEGYKVQRVDSGNPNAYINIKRSSFIKIRRE